LPGTGFCGPGDHFFLQHGDPDSPNQLCDQVEEHRNENPQAGSQNHQEQSEDRCVHEHLHALEREAAPAEGLEELLHVGDGAGGPSHVPQQDQSGEGDDVEREVNNCGHLEDAPRIHVTDGACDAANAFTRCWTIRGAHIASVLRTQESIGSLGELMVAVADAEL